MANAYTVQDYRGWHILTIVSRNRADAEQAMGLVSDPGRAPYRLERTPLPIARVDLERWRTGFTTDKAVDLTTNEGWEEL